MAVASPLGVRAALLARDIARVFPAVAGIYFFYLLYGWCQEKLYMKQGDGGYFTATAFVLFFQCVTNAAVALVVVLLQRLFRAPGAGSTSKGVAHGLGAASRIVADAGTVAPPGGGGGVQHDRGMLRRWRGLLLSPLLVQTAFVYVFAMYTSNEALAFVSYPTQALVKSCKMIPVMIGSFVINRTRYSYKKVACVVLMSLGILWFQLAAPRKAKGSHGPIGTAGATASLGPLSGEALGMFLLLASLALDGVTGPFQKRLQKETNNLDSSEQMMLNNVWGALFMTAVAFALGQITAPIAFLAAHPNLILDLVLFSLCSAFGQLFIFWTNKHHGPLTLSTITTTRKFFTILLSVWWNPSNRLERQQWLAVAFVIFGVSYDVLLDDHKKGKVKEEDGTSDAAAASAGGLMDVPAGGSGNSGPLREIVTKDTGR